MSTLMNPAAVLKSTFGYDSFRPQQEEIVEANLLNHDCLAILPTGGGKSLCYQLPAILREGLTLVVSPLIALMKDQIDQLEALGVDATCLNSSITSYEAQDRLKGLRAGRYKLLYVAPERLFAEGFIENLREWNLASVAIDEAHCISAWGHQFRPEYRQLSQLRKQFPKIPFIALTATATNRVRQDIVAQLSLKKPLTFIASFNRPNLHYNVLPKKKVAQQVCHYIKQKGVASGIVYCLAKKTTEQYATALQAIGVKAAPYHAGLSNDERARNQEAFIRDDISVICATIAFGMGINKPNVRYVLHADLPKNIESYYQETGRAGRDGLSAECMLLYSGGDLRTLNFFIDQLEDEETTRIARQQLRQMADFAENTGCRRSTLLQYFGEELPGDNCANCDNCLDKREKEDVTIHAIRLIYCVDMIAKSGYAMGLKHAVDVIRGSTAAKVIQKGHDKLKVYGKGAYQTAPYWMALGKQMIQHGYFVMPDNGYSTLTVTRKAIHAANNKEPIVLKLPALKPVKDPGGVVDIPITKYNVNLFEKLKSLRKSLADEKSVPPYVIFGDVTLRLMAQKFPSTQEEFLALSGVGEHKLVEYGSVFMDAISKWLETGISHKPPETSPKKNYSIEKTLELYRSGLNIKEIATERDFVESTITGHMAVAITRGIFKDAERVKLINTQDFNTITRTYEGLNKPDSFKPIHDALEEKFDYGIIRLAIAFYITDQPF